MSASLALFILSGLGLAAMLIGKYIQLRPGAFKMWGDIRTTTDETIQRMLLRLRRVLEYFRGPALQRALNSLIMITMRLLMRLVTASRAMHDRFLHYMHRTHMVRYRGPASFFLKHVSEQKLEVSQNRTEHRIL